jgi:hypothetical protein
MDREPLPLAEARRLHAVAKSGAAIPLTELERIRTQLRARAAHPSCGAQLAERIGGMLLVLDILALSHAEPQLSAVV